MREVERELRERLREREREVERERERGCERWRLAAERENKRAVCRASGSCG